MDEVLGALACMVIFVAQFLAVIAVQRWRDGDQGAQGSGLRSRASRLANGSLLSAFALVSSSAYVAPAGADQSDQRKVAIPGTAYEISVGGAATAPAAVLTPPFLAAVETWLSAQFGLPVFNRLPRIDFVPPDRMAALRYGPLLSQAMRSADLPQDTVAIYSDSELTIYLSNEWMGNTPADLSVLVHELVHHAQNLAGLKFECPQEREKLAYAAQDRWLILFGRSLAEDFELDGFTLLAKTRCFH
jgi:Domain of unknown function (DUF6647)